MKFSVRYWIIALMVVVISLVSSRLQADENLVITSGSQYNSGKTNSPIDITLQGLEPDNPATQLEYERRGPFWCWYWAAPTNLTVKWWFWGGSVMATGLPPDPYGPIVTLHIESATSGNYELPVSAYGYREQRVPDITDWEEYSSRPASITLYFTFYNMDLVVYNGGADLDRGESAGVQGDVVAEADEETTGSYVLVNWDDDDGDGTWAAGVVVNQPVPDLSEVPTGGGTITIQNEDNLAKLVPDVSNAVMQMTSCTMTLEIESGADRIKLWTQSTKGSLIALTNNQIVWNLSSETDRQALAALCTSGLWIEAIDPSIAERDISISFTLRDSANTQLAVDRVRITSVMINLGNAVYRENQMSGVQERHHGGLLTRYNGACVKDDLTNHAKYTLTEISGVTGNIVKINNTLETHCHSSAGSKYAGCYTNTGSIGNDIDGYKSRLKILATAQYFYDRGDLWYTGFDLFECTNEWDWGAIFPTYKYWAGNLADIKSMRCDGLVEVAYEMNGIMVWGKKNPDGNYGYDIKYWDATNYYYNLKIHNIYTFGDDPEDGEDDFYGWLAPVTQCGYADTYVRANFPAYTSGAFNYSANTFRGTFWQSTFQPSRAAYPASLSPETHP